MVHQQADLILPCRGCPAYSLGYKGKITTEGPSRVEWLGLQSAVKTVATMAHGLDNWQEEA
jgi:hypothetical protein